MDFKTIIDNEKFVSYSGHDKAALAISTEMCPCLVKNCTIDGMGSDWGFKSSKPFDLVVEDCSILNGVERALDIVRGYNIMFIGCKFLTTTARKVIKSKFELRKECDIGIKGGARDILFEDCEMNDLLLGDYSIYDQIDRPRTRRIILKNCKNPNGGNIIIRGRYFDKSSLVLINTKADVFVWPKWVTAIYWKWNRLFGDKRPLSEEQKIISRQELL